MHSKRWVAALLSSWRSPACAKGDTRNAGAPYAPYSPENNGNMHDSGGGGGGGVAWGVRNSGGRCGLISAARLQAGLKMQKGYD